MSITPEQLDEIEKLAEAATPGPWTARLTDRGHALWGPLPSGDWGTMRIALASYAEFDRANMLFMEALRDAALPLVKALREARVERDGIQEAFDAEIQIQNGLMDQFSTNDGETLFGLVHRLVEERNEARAEVERLRKLLNPEPKPDLGDTLMRLMRQDQRKEIYSRAWQEAILEGNTREQAHRIAADAVEAALKEGDR